MNLILLAIAPLVTLVVLTFLWRWLVASGRVWFRSSCGGTCRAIEGAFGVLTFSVMLHNPARPLDFATRRPAPDQARASYLHGGS